MKIIAAIDNSAAATPVLRAARAIAPLWEAQAEAIHILEDGASGARAAAEAVGMPIRFLDGPIVSALASETRDRDVAALAIGARGTPAGRAPVGRTAEQLLSAIEKPVLAVPPELPLDWVPHRAMISAAGSVPSDAALEDTMGRLCNAQMHVVVLHVIDERTLPLFSNHTDHDAQAWRTEFLYRLSPELCGQVELQERVGRPERLVIRSAVELSADLIVLAWSGSLAETRAPIVRHALDATPVPLLLVRVKPADLHDEISREPGSAPGIGSQGTGALRQ